MQTVKKAKYLKFPGLARSRRGKMLPKLVFLVASNACCVFILRLSVSLPHSTSHVAHNVPSLPYCEIIEAFQRPLFCLSGFGEFKSVLRQGQEQPLAASHHVVWCRLPFDRCHFGQAADRVWSIDSLHRIYLSGDETKSGALTVRPYSTTAKFAP